MDRERRLIRQQHVGLQAARGRPGRRRQTASASGRWCCAAAAASRPAGRGCEITPCPGRPEFDPRHPRQQARRRRSAGRPARWTETGAGRSRGSFSGESSPSSETIRLPRWVRSPRARPAPRPPSSASNASAHSAQHQRADGRSARNGHGSPVPGELEAAGVEAEGEDDVVGEVAVVDEAGGQPLGLDRVARPQLGGDLLQVGLLRLQVAEPLAQLGRVGGRPRRPRRSPSRSRRRSRSPWRTCRRRRRAVRPGCRRGRPSSPAASLPRRACRRVSSWARRIRRGSALRRRRRWRRAAAPRQDDERDPAGAVPGSSLHPFGSSLDLVMPRSRPPVD